MAADSIKTVFRRYDANGDGTISSVELRSVLKAISPAGKTFTDREIDSAFARIDVNKDGLIQYDEFVDWLLDDTVGFASIAITGGMSMDNRNAGIHSAIVADVEKQVGAGALLEADLEAAEKELDSACSPSDVEQKYAPAELKSACSALELEQKSAPPSEEKAASLEDIDMSGIADSLEIGGDESDFLDCIALFRRLDSKQLRQAFHEADVNKSNYLSLTELRRFLFPKSSSNDKSLCVSKIFAQMDKNHDGKVGCGEFCSYIISTKELLCSIPDAADKKHIATAFSTADRDKSAGISASEFAVLLGASSEEEKSTIQKAFKALDCNSDGALSVIEFSRVYGKELVQEARAPEVTWKEIPPDEDDDD
mmetsp:Transcript_122598/g.216055  ORF Transcript_122598/g.216055 Transcript_122598/m.216055 type:complete len:367 (+) Transcript_122598:53-1153(+)